MLICFWSAILLPTIDHSSDAIKQCSILSNNIVLVLLYQRVRYQRSVFLHFRTMPSQDAFSLERRKICSKKTKIFWRSALFFPKPPKLKFCLWKICSKHEFVSEKQCSFQNVKYVTMFWQCQKRSTLFNMQRSWKKCPFSLRTLRAIFLQNMPCILPRCRILLEEKYVASKSTTFPQSHNAVAKWAKFLSRSVPFLCVKRFTVHFYQQLWFKKILSKSVVS